MPAKPATPRYTCEDYRLEMMLLGLQKQLQDPHITGEQRRAIKFEIQRLQQELGMD